MNKNGIVYKVVWHYCDRYYSSHTRVSNFSCSVKDYTIEYVLGKEVFPLTGKIFVFSDLESARNFRNEQRNFNSYILGKVEIIKGIGKNISRPFYCSYDINGYEFSEFWKKKRNHKYTGSSSRMSVIPGTIWVDSFIGQEIVE